MSQQYPNHQKYVFTRYVPQSTNQSLVTIVPNRMQQQQCDRSRPPIYVQGQPHWVVQQQTTNTSPTKYVRYFTDIPSHVVSPSQRRCHPLNKCISIPMWSHVRAVPLSFFEPQRNASDAKSRTNCRPQNKGYSRLRKDIINKKPIRHHNRVSKSSEENADLSWFFDPKKKKRDIVSSWFDDVSDSDVEETCEPNTDEKRRVPIFYSD
uniref:uncharacterized protein LOC100186530 isoform X1 n=1 Tax=Ciona intestinalis TaxID=7719 RepID=UPI000180C2FF|nr:uncharacterized protein LOC100186530 isoform X1 [Ciona intestinalis]|eukprot:XP_026691341.1 uncharacterized protein LOC100186530 isoform X1 [Ciona intestinalis]